MKSARGKPGRFHAKEVAMSEYKDDCPARQLKKFWFDDLKFCACGTQGEVLGVFRDAMQIMHDRSERNRDGGQAEWMEHCRKLDALWNGNTAFEYLVLYTLDAQGLTEHGGSVGGSWPTPAGDEFLGWVAGKTDEQLDDMLNHDEDIEHELES